MTGRLSLLGAGKQTAGGEEWTPLSISGCKLWLDFSDADTLFTDAGTTKVSTDGQPVYQANDKSGTDNHALQATADARPTYKVNQQNSLSALYFDGGDWLNFTTATSSTPVTIFWVGYDTYNGYGGLFGINNAYYPVIKRAGAQINVRPHIGTDLISSIGASANKILTVFHASDGGTLTIRANGEQKASGDRDGYLGLFTHLGSIKDSPSAAEIYDAGNMLEVIIYDSVLSGGDITTVETYLNNKWAI